VQVEIPDIEIENETKIAKNKMSVLKTVLIVLGVITLILIAIFAFPLFIIAVIIALIVFAVKSSAKKNKEIADEEIKQLQENNFEITKKYILYIYTYIYEKLLTIKKIRV